MKNSDDEQFFFERVGFTVVSTRLYFWGSYWPRRQMSAYFIALDYILRVIHPQDRLLLITRIEPFSAIDIDIALL